MQNWGYKLQNNTVNSVFDCESNNENDMFEGAKVVYGERYGFSDTLFTFLEQICNLLKYDTSWPFKGDKSL
jgi:hypothetical protein